MSDDIVSRLWQYTPEAPNTPMETRLLLNDAAHEIERLREAGDALAQGIRTGHWDDALDTWTELRGGQ